jgi:hypothetical protein
MNLTWTGSDLLFCTKYPKASRKIKYIYMFCLRIFARIADFFVHKHIVVSKHLLPEIESMKFKKPIEVRENPVLYADVYPKQEHKGFNVLYYRGIGKNQVFMDWLYGYDIIKELKNQLPEINVIEVNGKANMAKVYPIVDFYARPNRHDGSPRMVRECIINKIPVYHSNNNPCLKTLIKDIKAKMNE